MQVWGLIREAFREGFTKKSICSFGFCPNYIYLSWRKFADSLLEFGNSRRDLDKNTEFSTWNLQISSRQELLFSFDDENCPILCYSRENARTAFLWWTEKTVILVAARIAFSPINREKCNSRRDENCFSRINREKCNSRRDENCFSLKQREVVSLLVL